MHDWETVFATERPRLFGLAYRMLGRAAEAEDVLQEAWLRVHARDRAEAKADEPVRAPAALLRTVVTRLCLDQLKSARAQREQYVGPWLPEPVYATPAPDPAADDRIGEAESLSMAFLLLLESLSPAERAVFVLREVFDYGFDEIALCLGKTEAACRQLAHRARSHVADRRPRFRASPEQRSRLLQTFMTAVAAGDVGAVSALLSAEASASSDGGGEVRAALNEVHGRDRVARLMVGLGRRGLSGATYEPGWLNGCPALLFFRDGELWGVLLLEEDGEQVHAVRIVLAPGKLRFLKDAHAKDAHART